jgi:hypothetical protein
MKPKGSMFLILKFKDKDCLFIMLIYGLDYKFNKLMVYLYGFLNNLKTIYFYYL